MIMEVKVEIVIILDNSDRILVKSSSQNNITNVGMLDIAKTIIANQLKPVDQSSIISPLRN